FSIPAIREHLKKSGDQPVTLGIERDGKGVELQIQPQLKAERKTTLTLRINNEDNLLSLHFFPKYAEPPTEVPSPETRAKLILFEIEGHPDQSGFKPRIGDILTKIGNHSINSIQDAEIALKKSNDTSKVLSLQSGDIQRNLNLPETTQIIIDPVVIQPLLGFVMGGETRIHLNPLTQIRRHFNTTLQVLGSLLNRNSDIGVQQLSGPIGIGRVFHRYANIDFRLVLVFAVLLNINLAILNMLPIPVLDGGHILFATVAKLRKKGLPIGFIVRIQTVFVLLLFSMIIYVGVYDSLRWKGDNQEEHRYEILRSLYFDPAILTTSAPEPPNKSKPNLDGKAVE
ncbi:MAG: site-2 protease family protein, partial [Opitutae bacterium]|nr:site-2 protease family protein [Opitutae bacterium]